MTGTVEQVHGFCALCVSRCGAVAHLEDGRFTRLEPDPAHPTGQALCAKGRAAPELVYHRDRLLHPLRRTRPKGDPDPGWQRIGWDEALDVAAGRLRELARLHGPESVAFSLASPSTSGSSDCIDWLERLPRAFGSPNIVTSVELCGWGRYLANLYTYGASVPGRYMPDLERAGCILFWGYNPNLARLTHGVAAADALRRGARLIVVDPRRVGLANKADVWLRVRPGTDAALALGLAGVLIERGWYDVDFLRTWTNAPLLVRSDTGRLLRQADVEDTPDAHALIAWDATAGRPAYRDPAARSFSVSVDRLALTGEYVIPTVSGRVLCRPVFDLLSRHCRNHSPQLVESICGVAPDQLEAAARLLWQERPVAYYAWSGVEMQTGATQIARAIAQLHALTGSFDVPGGNVLYTAVPAPDMSGAELLPSEQAAKALGLAERPLGPARWQYVATADVYRAILERRPYAVRGLVGFGANLLLAQADSRRGREALAALDFYVHADLFMTPTCELADIVLPVASPFEREALRIGFETSQAAQAHVQLRRRVVAPRGEARSDQQIVFDLACRLGLGEHFFHGDIEAAWRHELAGSGVSLEELRAHPGGVRLPLRTRYRKYAEAVRGAVRGFATPSHLVELYSETLLAHGYPPLPVHERPLAGHAARPAARERFPLILTCAKHTLFCETQHRALPSLRRRAMDPEVELHPAAAAQRGIAAGDWVRIETPRGSVRARARFNDSLEESVVCGQHGWWQACAEVGAAGYDPFSDEGANFNLLIGADAVDPISGSVPHRAYVCEVARADAPISAARVAGGSPAPR